MHEQFDAHEQIIYQGHTPQRVWEALAQRSRETRIKIDLQCPNCDAEIHHNATTLHCRSCSAPVSVYQHRHHTDTADTRLIYIHVLGKSRAVVSLVMHCLSCEQHLTEEETCTNTCEIQTYLVFERDGELYVKRWVNTPSFKREPTEIDTRPLPDTDRIRRANDTPHTENLPQNQPQAPDVLRDEHPNAHTDIAGQILAYLTEHKQATTGEMIAAFNTTPEGFRKAKEKLLKHGQIRQIKRGCFEFINHP